MAGLAVAVLTWEAGTLPLLSLGLTISWGFYALFKRALPIGPNQGFTLEVLLLLPFASGYLAWLWSQGQLAFGHEGTARTALLVGAGVVTKKRGKRTGADTAWAWSFAATGFDERSVPLMPV